MKKIKTVLITKNAKMLIQNEIDINGKQTETGGALVGYQVQDIIVVTHASGPGKKSKRTRYSVEIDGNFTTQYCNRLNLLSNYNLYYIGDWHTHLTDCLNPSRSDYIAMTTIYKEMNIDENHSLISVILFHNCIEKVRAYAIDKNNREFYEIKAQYVPNPSCIIPYI